MEKNRNIQILGHILPLSKADPAQNCILFKFLEIYFHTIKAQPVQILSRLDMRGKASGKLILFYMC